MELIADLAAILVALGAALAAATGGRRFAILGLTVALVAAPLVVLPWPALLPLAFREVAAGVGAYLLWVTAGHIGIRPSHAEPRGAMALFVLAAFAIVAILAPSLGPGRDAFASASAAATAMAGIALVASSARRELSGLGAVFLVASATLAMAAIRGSGGPLDDGVVGAALLSVTAAAAFAAGAEAPVAR